MTTSSIRSIEIRLVAAIAASLGTACGHAAPSSTPPPGQYRIDSETITTVHGIAGDLVTTQTVDGASGRITVVSKGPDGKATTRVHPGDGPQVQCVAHGGSPAPILSAASCLTPDSRAPGSADGSRLAWECAGTKFQMEWSRIDDSHWESRLVAVETMAAAAGPGAMPAATAEAMKPVIAQLEEVVRSGAPADAAAAREQLALLRGTGDPSTPAKRIEERRRWVRFAETCK